MGAKKPKYSRNKGRTLTATKFFINKKPGNYLAKQGGFQVFFVPLSGNRTFSGSHYTKYYYNTSISRGLTG